METEELLVALSWTSNRSLSQTRMLFDLCGQSFEKLLQLEAYQRRTFQYACPSIKEDVDEQLVKWAKLREEDKSKKH